MKTTNIKDQSASNLEQKLVPNSVVELFYSMRGCGAERPPHYSPLTPIALQERYSSSTGALRERYSSSTGALQEPYFWGVAGVAWS